MSESVYLLLLEWHENNKEFVKRNISLLDGIKELSHRNFPLWVFSLNQDLIMECFSAYSGNSAELAGSPKKSSDFRYETTVAPK